MIGSRRQTVVSFEEDTVKVIRASRTAGKTAVDRSQSFTNEEFNDYLRTTTERNFVVVCTFRRFFQDTFSFPPAKEKYYPTLIDAEIRKNSLGAKDYLFFYHILEDNQQEGRKTRETFVLAVEREIIDGIVERFDRCGKTIIALYPSVVTLTSLLAPMEEVKDDVVLGILEAGKSKILFLIKDRALCFVRFIQSDAAGINDLDVDNINMTISYFRQTLRVNPSKVVLLNFRESTEVAARIVVPVVDMGAIPRLSVAGTIAEEYIVPISVLADSVHLAHSNLLPPVYKTLPIQKRILSAAMALLVLVTLGCLGSIVFSVQGISVRKDAIARMEREIAQKEPAFRDYRMARDRLQTVQPLLAYANKAFSLPETGKILAALGFLPLDHVVMESIQIDVKEGETMVHLKGAIQATDYAGMDSDYRTLLSRMRKVERLEILSHEIDPKDMTFTIEAKWTI
jgi:hypothetical protein